MTPDNHQKVDSTSIDSVGYDEDTQELHIDFHRTGRYIYRGVPKEIYEEMMISSSKGAVFHSKIKGKYQFERG